ncbi:MAG: hypothetical protein Q7T55_07700 [Solirubrobacteraceae bacterium]|nr:hypothetical protein [Solirubrobacteraceae bacterium]
MVLDLAAIPSQPPSVDEASSLASLLDNDLARFAMTFDGVEQFGEHWPEALQARIEEWEDRATLPRDLDALRGLLSLAVREERFLELDGSHSVVDDDGTVVHEADPADAITEARRAHERFKHALLARIRELAAEPAAAEPAFSE